MLNDYLFGVSRLSEYDSFRELNFHRILLDGEMQCADWLADDKSWLGILHRKKMEPKLRRFLRAKIFRILLLGATIVVIL